MEIVRPRLTDYYGIHQSQSQMDFAIQFFNEDIPLYVDPFLLWKSPSQQDNSLHTAITNSFNYLNYLIKKGREGEAASLLVDLSECSEVGLGVSKSRVGNRIGIKQSASILSLFKKIPEYSNFGFTHFEAIQLYVDGIGRDRVSDISCNYAKSFLIDYTTQQCEEFRIPLSRVTVGGVYSCQKNRMENDVAADLPINPITKEPIIFTPKRWLRFNQWINYEDYFKAYCPCDEIFNPSEPVEKVRILNFNRNNYDVVLGYVESKKLAAGDCKNDPLFSQIPIVSAKRKLAEIVKLRSGKDDGADAKYEDYSTDLMASLLYPQLDFAKSQSRTDSGSHIRDLIFYNNRGVDFLDEILKDYGNRQLVIEMKNVKAIDRDHINQLNRYLQSSIGNFGIFLTRNPLSRAMYKNTVDLWSAQRKCIIVLTDEDLKLMVDVFESKQRLPIDVIKKKYVEFRRSCPS